MNRISTATMLTRHLPRIAALTMLSATAATAQVPVDEAGNPLTPLDSSTGYYAAEATAEAVQPLTPAELETLIGPVALYPDDLLAIVLPASTYPLEIVQAARFLEEYKIDSSLTPSDEWDESVTALLNYPEVIEMLNNDIDWTWKLGEAVVRQQQDVIAAVESFRDRAYAAGNLRSDEYQNVTEDEGIIEIVPIDDDIIYVPYYEPEHVVVTQPRRVYHYYPSAYPLYYYPYPYGYSFTTQNFWGVTTAFRIGWATDYLHVHHRSYWGHPYYGRSYYGHNYRNTSINVYNTTYVNNRNQYRPNRHRDGDHWRPRKNRGARPTHYRANTRSYRNSAVVPGTDIDRDVRTPTTNRRNSTGRRNENLSDTFRNRPTRNTTSERNVARTNTPRKQAPTRQQNSNQTTTTRRQVGVARNDDVRVRSNNRTRSTTPQRTATAPRRTETRRTERPTSTSSQRKAAPAPSRATRQTSRQSNSAAKRSQNTRTAAARSSSRSQGREGARRTKRH